MRRMPLLAIGSSLVGISWLLVVGMKADDQVAVSAAIQGTTPQISELAEFTVERLQLPQVGRAPFETAVTLNGTPMTLSLRPHSVRSADFQLVVQGADGELHEEIAPPSTTYRGVVNGLPGSQVRGSLFEGQFTAMVRVPGEGLYNILPLTTFDAQGDPADHVIVHEANVLIDPYRCGVDDIEQPNLGIDDEAQGGGGGIAGTGLRVCDIACDADGEFYQRRGSSIPTVVRDIENVLNAVESIYERDVDITYEVTHIIVWTNPATDPYFSSNASTILNEFRNYWIANFRSVQRDVAEHFTGKNIIGGTIGIAWLSSVCDNVGSGRGYNVVESLFTSSLSFRACLSAHELGHNFAAQHCDGLSGCRIMCSGLGGCRGCGSFGPTSVRTISSFRNSRGCLENLADPRELPFFDDFPNIARNSANWSYNNGTTINSNAVGEPSGTLSLNLNASGSAAFRDDDIRSNFIRLAGASDVTLSYHTQHRGVESGEQLVVDYWNNNLTWVEINRVTSNGTNQNSFTFWSHSLPASALHDEFRIRFRPEVDQTDDNWYVDDVLVDGTPPLRFDVTVDAGPFVGFVPITVFPPDINGNSDGITVFVRRYDPGRRVTLTAPATTSGVPFTRWELDGVSASVTQSVIFDVTQDVTATAVYLPNVTLTVDSSPDPNVLIFVSPPDRNAQGDGFTPFSRVYAFQTEVTLRSPPSWNSLNFSHWTVGGVNQPAGQEEIMVAMNGNLATVANFGGGGCAGFVCGDANCDGTFNGGDIDDFFVALGDPTAWMAAHPGCDMLCVADINRDGSVNGGDIDEFFMALSVGHCP